MNQIQHKIQIIEVPIEVINQSFGVLTNETAKILNAELLPNGDTNKNLEPSPYPFKLVLTLQVLHTPATDKNKTVNFMVLEPNMPYNLWDYPQGLNRYNTLPANLGGYVLLGVKEICPGVKELITLIQEVIRKYGQIGSIDINNVPKHILEKLDILFKHTQSVEEDERYLLKWGLQNGVLVTDGEATCFTLFKHSEQVISQLNLPIITNWGDYQKYLFYQALHPENPFIDPSLGPIVAIKGEA